MRFRTTIILLFLNLFVLFFLIRQGGSFSSEPSRNGESAGVMPFPLSEAQMILVEGKLAKETRQWINRDGNWDMVLPVEWAANPFAIRRMINSLDSLNAGVRFKVDDLEDHGQKLTDFGLDDPSLTVKARFNDTEYQIAFGSPTEIGNRIYMLSPDEREILVVDSNTIEPFVAPLEDLRDKALFPIPLFEARALSVEFYDDPYRARLTRREDQWYFDAPVSAMANEARVHSALGRLIGLSATGLAKDEASANPPAGQPVARIELVGNRRNNTLILSELRIGGEIVDDFYKARFEGSSTSFILPRTELDLWRSISDSLRERRLIWQDPSKVSKVELIRHRSDARPDSGTIRLLKLEDGVWRVFGGVSGSDPMPYNGDEEAIAAIVGRLEDMVVLEFVSDNPSDEDLKRFGLMEPLWTIRTEGEETLEIRVGSLDEGQTGYYVQLTGNPSVYLVGVASIDGLSVEPLDYRERRMELYPQDQTLASWSLEAADVSGGWIPVPGMDRVDLGSLNQASEEDPLTMAKKGIGALLSGFEVRGFVTGPFESTGCLYQGERIPWSIRLSGFVSGQAQEPAFVVLLTRRLSGTVQLGAIESNGVSFELDQTMVDLLHTLTAKDDLPPEYALPDAGDGLIDPEPDLPPSDDGLENGEGEPLADTGTEGDA